MVEKHYINTVIAEKRFGHMGSFALRSEYLKPGDWLPRASLNGPTVGLSRQVLCFGHGSTLAPASYLARYVLHRATLAQGALIARVGAS